MSRETTAVELEAEGSETARGGFRPSSPGRQRILQGSFEEWPSGGLSLLAEAAETFTPLGVPHLWSQSTPQVGLGLLHSRSFQTPSGPTQPPISYRSASMPPSLPGQMPSATQPFYFTTSASLAPVQPPYLMPPATSSQSPLDQHSPMAPEPTATTSSNSSYVYTSYVSLNCLCVLY